MHFCSLGTNATNGFHVKAKNERFTAPGLRCLQNLKSENSRRHLVDYVKELHQKAWRACSTIIFPHSTKQIIDLWCCLVAAVVISQTPRDFEFKFFNRFSHFVSLFNF